MKLVAGADEAVATWVARQLGVVNFGPCSAFGVMDEGGEHVGGIVFHNYHPRYRSVEISLAMRSPHWATREIIRRTLGFAFEHLACGRITLSTPQSAASARRLLTKLGFKQEGLVRRGFGTDDAVISGLLEEEWRSGRWGPLADGQGHAPSP